MKAKRLRDVMQPQLSATSIEWQLNHRSRYWAIPCIKKQLRHSGWHSWDADTSGFGEFHCDFWDTVDKVDKERRKVQAVMEQDKRTARRRIELFNERPAAGSDSAGIIDIPKYAREKKVELKKIRLLIRVYEIPYEYSETGDFAIFEEDLPFLEHHLRLMGALKNDE